MRKIAGLKHLAERTAAMNRKAEGEHKVAPVNVTAQTRANNSEVLHSEARNLKGKRAI